MDKRPNSYIKGAKMKDQPQEVQVWYCNKYFPNGASKGLCVLVFQNTLLVKPENTQATSKDDFYTSPKFSQFKKIINSIDGEPDPYYRKYDYAKLLTETKSKFDISDIEDNQDFKRITQLQVTKLKINPLDYHGDKLNKKFQLEHKGIALGEVNYGITNGELEIGSLSVERAFNQKGLSTVFFQKILLDNPQVSQIKTRLSGDNMWEINNYCLNQGYKNFKKAPKHIQLEAIQNTPAFRTRVKLGFDEILYYQYKPSTGELNESVVLSTKKKN